MSRLSSEHQLIDNYIIADKNTQSLLIVNSISPLEMKSHYIIEHKFVYLFVCV